jgi:hypothetical protein
MNTPAHLPRFMPTPRRRDGHLARMRVRVRRAGLDRRLAAGEDPGLDADLRRRAAELAEGDARRRIAIVLDRILDEAVGPPAPFSSKVPLARAAIVACAPRLTEIAGRLEGDGPVAARGVAQAALLIHRWDSPLFSPTITDTALNRRLAGIVAALDPAERGGWAD